MRQTAFASFGRLNISAMTWDSRPKAVTQTIAVLISLCFSAMPEILIRCRTSGKAVPTGLSTEKIRFESLSGMEFSIVCPACGKIHIWNNSEAWIDTSAKKSYKAPAPMPPEVITTRDNCVTSHHRWIASDQAFVKRFDRLLFNCPNCDAVYRLVKAEAGPETVDRELTCRSCAAPLPAREGNFVMKYFLLRKADRPPHNLPPHRQAFG
jgi:hypothetical protein